MQHLYISVTKKRWLQLQCISFILKISFTSMKDIWGLLMSRGSIDLHFYIAWQSDEKLGDVMDNFFFERTAEKVKWKFFVCTKAMSCNKSLSGVHRCKWYHQMNNMLMHFAPMTSALLKNLLSFGFVINNLIHRFNELIDMKFIRRKLGLRSSKLAEPFVNTLRHCAYIAVRPFSQYLPIELHFCNYKENWIMLFFKLSIGQLIQLLDIFLIF